MPNDIATGMTDAEYQQNELLLRNKVKDVPIAIIPRIDLDEAPYEHQLDKLLVHRPKLNAETNCRAHPGHYDDDHAATIWHFGLDAEHSWESGDTVTKARVVLTQLEHVSGQLNLVDRLYLDAWLEYTQRSKVCTARKAFVTFWNSPQAGRDVLMFTQAQIDLATARLDQLKGEFVQHNKIVQSQLQLGAYSQEAYDLVRGLLFDFPMNAPVPVTYNEMIPIQSNDLWAALQFNNVPSPPNVRVRSAPSLAQMTRTENLIPRLMGPGMHAPPTTVHTLVRNMEIFLTDSRAGAHMPTA